MTHDIATRDGLPEDMQFLLRGLPRDGWQAHPGLKRATRQWLGAHDGFRQLSDILLKDSEAFLDGALDRAAYTRRLGMFGGRLLGNLHGHHSWEDHRFFTELEGADPRFADGLEMLERDHATLDATLDGLKRQANRVIQLETLAPREMVQEAGPLRDRLVALGGFLDRHLTDEEDLVVPIVLTHRLRG